MDKKERYLSIERIFQKYRLLNNSVVGGHIFEFCFFVFLIEQDDKKYLASSPEIFIDGIPGLKEGPCFKFSSYWQVGAKFSFPGNEGSQNIFIPISDGGISIKVICCERMMSWGDVCIAYKNGKFDKFEESFKI